MVPVCRLRKEASMVFGISTACFYPELTEKAAEWIAGAGIPAAEVFFNAPS